MHCSIYEIYNNINLHILYFVAVCMDLASAPLPVGSQAVSPVLFSPFFFFFSFVVVVVVVVVVLLFVCFVVVVAAAAAVVIFFVVCCCCLFVCFGFFLSCFCFCLVG